MLVMMGGLPGAGKSHLAQALARRVHAVIVSVDPIEDAMVRSGLAMSFQTGLAAYEVGATFAAAQLNNGLTVIADAANYLEVGRDVWRRAADRAQVPVKVIDVICSDTVLHRRRLEARRRGLSEYPEPSWDDVMKRAAETEPWPGERLVIDSTRPLDDGVDAALAFIGA